MNDLAITNENLRKYACESNIKTLKNFFIMKKFENIQKLAD